MDRRRVKSLSVSERCLNALLSQQFTNQMELVVPVCNDLPSDFEVQRVEYDYQRGSFVLLIWSASFDVVPNGREPEWIETEEKRRTFIAV